MLPSKASVVFFSFQNLWRKCLNGYQTFSKTKAYRNLFIFSLPVRKWFFFLVALQLASCTHSLQFSRYKDWQSSLAPNNVALQSLTELSHLFVGFPAGLGFRFEYPFAYFLVAHSLDVTRPLELLQFFRITLQPFVVFDSMYIRYFSEAWVNV